MAKKTFSFILSLVLIISTLFGCSSINKKVGDYNNNLGKCTLNRENVTKFNFKGKEYTILSETREKQNFGKLVGYIRKLAVTDENGKIISEENSANTSAKRLAETKKTSPNACYIVPLLNVYNKSGEESLTVDANGEFHKAVLSNQVKSTDKIFDYKKKSSETSCGEFCVNPKNCAELICDGKTYKVTEETLKENQVGDYLDVLAKSVTFNKETGKSLSKDEFLKIDASANGGSKIKRETYIYGEVHKIKNKNLSEAVAVEINAKYRVARAK